MDYYLAIAGSTQVTHALLASRDGTEAYSGTFPGLHARESHEPHMEQVLESIIAEMAERAGVEREELRNRCKRLVFAVSGTDDRFDNGLLLGRLRFVGFKQITDKSLQVIGIGEATYRAVLTEQPGILIRSGAGCSVFGVNSANRCRLMGAWGTILSGRGSGTMLGEQVFHMATATFDGVASRGERRIAKSAMSKCKVRHGVELLEHMQRVRRMGGNSAIMAHLSSTLADALFEEAGKGNDVALATLDRASQYLRKLAERAILKLRLDTAPFSLFFQGQLLETHPAMANRLYTDIASRFPCVRYVGSLKHYHSRVVGAMKLAYCGAPLKMSTSSKLRRFEASLAGFSPTSHPELFWLSQDLWSAQL